MDPSETKSEFRAPSVDETEGVDGSRLSTEAKTHHKAQRAGWFQSAGQGARVGFRLMSYLIAPIVIGVATPLLVFYLVHAVIGRSGILLPLSKAARVLIGMFNTWFLSAVLGVILGTVIGQIVGLFRPYLPKSRVSDWLARMGQPIRLVRSKHERDYHPGGPMPSPHRYRWVGLLAVPSFMVASLIYGTGAFLMWKLERRCTIAIEQADRDDPNWRLDDLMAHREVVPDEENSALVVAEVVSLLPKDWPPAPSQDLGGSDESPISPREIYDRVFNIPENVRLDDSLVDPLRAEFAAHDETVQLARTIGGYARGRHELQLTPSLIDTPLGETQETRGVARLLFPDAALRAHAGDLDGALESSRDMLGVGRSIGDEPFAVSLLVRIAVGRLAIQSARRTLGQGEPSDDALALTQAQFLDELAQPILLNALKGERAVYVEVIRRISAGELPISALSDPGSSSKFESSNYVVPVWGNPLFDSFLTVTLEWMTDAVSIARRPSSERPGLWKAWNAEIERVRRSRFGLITAGLPIVLMPALNASAAAHARYEANLGASVILMAAERYRQRTGDWPESVSAIDSDILPDPPVDPYSGQPFLMEHRDGQLFVYSIGPNQKDEHGAFDLKRWSNGKLDDMGASAWDLPLRRQTAPISETPALAPSG